MSIGQKLLLLGILLMLNLLVWGNLEAADWRAGVLVGAEHWDSSDWNEDPEGIYGCVNAFCVGQYENSYSHKDDNPKAESTFIMYDHRFANWGPVEFSVGAGFVDGYKDYSTDYEWMPFAGVTARIGIIKWWQFGKVSAYGLEVGGDL